MLIIKVCDDKPTPLINDVIANNHKEIKINDDSLELLKHYLDEGRNIKVKKDDKFIDANVLFEENGEQTFDNYEDLFNVHYKKRIDNIKKYTENIEELEKILEFAKENEQPDSVLEDIKEYIKDLK